MHQYWLHLLLISHIVQSPKRLFQVSATIPHHIPRNNSLATHSRTEVQTPLAKPSVRHPAASGSASANAM